MHLFEHLSETNKHLTVLLHFRLKHLLIMKILKKVGIALAALIGLILIAGIFVDKEVDTAQSIVIDAPVAAVFNEVNDFSNWESWSPWKEMDSTLQITLGEKFVGEGGSYSWTAEVVGNGDMSIVSSTPNESLKTKVNFGDEGSADGSWTFEEVEGGTKVTWGIHAPFPYPMNVMLLFMDMKGDINKSFSRGLELLKEVVEREAGEQNVSLEVQEVEMPVRYYIGVRETIKMADIAERYAENLPKAMMAVMDKKIELAGMPSGLFYSWDEETKTTDVLQGIPVKEKAEIEGFTTVEVPASKTLLINFYGDFSGIGKAHEAMEAYISANGLTSKGLAIEEYVTDPGEEPDPAKWLTKVMYIVE